MASDPFGQGWIKSKLIQFMVIYWGAIVLLTYLARWVEQHADALTFLFQVMAVGLLIFSGLFISVYLYRRGRRW